MEVIDENIKIAWERRSLHYGKKPEGVLPKSLPRSVNDYLDNWMYTQVKSKIKKLGFTSGAQKSKILDLGCGYGRLSGKLLKEFPTAQTIGIDVAQNYVDIYNKELAPRGKAIRGDIRKLPFAENSFDLVFTVTTLMYIVKKSEQEKAIKECLRVLRTGGYLVIIEPNPTGHSIVTLGGIITKLRGRKNAGIPSVGYTPSRMLTLIEKSGGKLLAVSGIPFWTLSLPFSIFLSHLSHNLALWFLEVISSMDKQLGRLLTPSLYISYTCTKAKINKFVSRKLEINKFDAIAIK